MLRSNLYVFCFNLNLSLSIKHLRNWANFKRTHAFLHPPTIQPKVNCWFGAQVVRNSNESPFLPYEIDHHLMHVVALRFLPIFDQDRRELVQQGETHEQHLDRCQTITWVSLWVLIVFLQTFMKCITCLGICLHRLNHHLNAKQRLKESEMVSTFAESQRSLSKWIPWYIWTTGIHCVSSKVQQFLEESAAWCRINGGDKEDGYLRLWPSLSLLDYLGACFMVFYA